MLIQYIGNPSKIGRDESGISDGSQLEYLNLSRTSEESDGK
jgi:hypothetical protein